MKYGKGVIRGFEAAAEMGEGLKTLGTTAAKMATGEGTGPAAAAGAVVVAKAGNGLLQWGMRLASIPVAVTGRVLQKYSPVIVIGGVLAAGGYLWNKFRNRGDEAEHQENIRNILGADEHVAAALPTTQQMVNSREPQISGITDSQASMQGPAGQSWGNYVASQRAATAQGIAPTGRVQG